MIARTSVAAGVRLVACALSLHGGAPLQAQEPQAASVPSASPSASGAGATNKKTCRPEYPDAALRAKAEGTTVVKFTVPAGGGTATAEVVGSAGPTPEHKMLDEAALAALRACVFKPVFDASGKPVETTVKLDYRWVLAPPAVTASSVRP